MVDKVKRSESVEVRLNSGTVHNLAEIGAFVKVKYFIQARNSGVYQAAKNMRKQGFPIEVALRVLL